MIHLYSAFDKVVIIQVEHRFVSDKTYILQLSFICPKVTRQCLSPRVTHPPSLPDCLCIVPSFPSLFLRLIPHSWTCLLLTCLSHIPSKILSSIKWGFLLAWFLSDWLSLFGMDLSSVYVFWLLKYGLIYWRSTVRVPILSNPNCIHSKFTSSCRLACCTFWIIYYTLTACVLHLGPFVTQ